MTACSRLLVIKVITVPGRLCALRVRPSRLRALPKPVATRKRILANVSRLGLARAKASKAEGAKLSKKRTASKSLLREKKETQHIYQSIFDSSDEEEEKEEEEEEDAIAEPREVSNDLDQQQKGFQAAQRMRGGSVVARVSQRAAINSRGYWPPEESSGDDLFLELLVASRGLVGGHMFLNVPLSTIVTDHAALKWLMPSPNLTGNLEVARCVLLAPHRIPLKDSTACRKKPENRGGLHPLWGYP
ncbi:hypothetical protein PInf_006755 [Phytophthora infestans]|nr:hypothetical protein PInf_006755 [Phytophthora infestans]